MNTFIDTLPEERRAAMHQLRKAVKDNLPEDFSESLQNNMIAYTVPFSIYPNGYHCNPKQPLPFVNLASQKNFIALYHMGIYANPELLEWFQQAYPKHAKRKLDMGKSCIRFKKMDDIPFDLIAELMTKMTAAEWISLYESKFKQ